MLLAAVLALVLGGVVLSLAASPPVASRLGLDPFYFVTRHVLYVVPAIAVMLATFVSAAAPCPAARASCVRVERRLGGRHAPFRCGSKGRAPLDRPSSGINIQPSEFLKPSLVILIAWLFGESARRPEMPANTMALALLLSNT